MHVSDACISPLAGLGRDETMFVWLLPHRGGLSKRHAESLSTKIDHFSHFYLESWGTVRVRVES